VFALKVEKYRRIPLWVEWNVIPAIHYMLYKCIRKLTEQEIGSSDLQFSFLTVQVVVVNFM